MDEAANRPGRIDLRDERAFSPRLRSHALALAALALCAFALGAGSAQAATGGFSAAPEGQGQAQASGDLAFTPMRWAGATWYGPGLYGNMTACGQVLRPGTMGVANRSLPCGTRVKFAYRGRQIVTRVIDRGPFSPGHAWDLTNGVREALGFAGSNRVRYAVELRYARR
ncbi:MAG TPA: septal ring lytic transglycosylase RlpA family protein [Solirubrobacterales bacterium]|nr:septal ring lytic transglycosylase RlpA family protein [Solirubrobacterales bacterium]